MARTRSYSVVRDIGGERVTYMYRGGKLRQAVHWDTDEDQVFGESELNGAPVNLILTVVSSTENQLDWTRGATNEDYVIIERSDDGGSFFELVTLTAGTIQFLDVTAAVGVLHIYRVRVKKGFNYSSYSNTIGNTLGDITTGLVGRWLLTENTGATAYDTAGANNGIITGADWDAGFIDYSLYFNGTVNSDVVRLGDILDATFSGANAKFTIAAWAKPAATLTGAIILGKFNSTDGQRQFGFEIATNSKLRFLWYGSLAGTTYRGHLGSTPITDTTKWYHVVMTYDGTLTQDSRVNFYVDAALETTTISLTAGTPAAIADGTAQLAIGAYSNVAGTTSSNNFNGKICYVNVFNRILSYADVIALKYFNAPAPLNTAKIYSYNAGQDDVFLDSLYLSSLTNIHRKINNPVKYIGNPLFETGENTATWDHDKGFPNIFNIAGSWKMWYTALRDGGVPPYLQAYATSSDGLAWTKPNLGLVSYEGNTNNNLIFGLGAFGGAIVYDPDASADLRYICSLANNAGYLGGEWETSRFITIYKSADGINWTQIKQFRPAANPYLEASEIVKRPDGKWIVYYIWYGLVDTRRVGAFLSDSTDLTGTWTDQGTVIDTAVNTDQKYTINVDYIDGMYYGNISNFNSTSDKVFTDFYTSRNGLVWVKKIGNWIPNGPPGAWDQEGTYGAKSAFIHVGNEWLMYYSGSVYGHAHAIPRDGRIGLAKIGYKRICNMEGNGTIITTAFTPTLPLMLNADLTNGTLKVELLLAADNSVIAGYSKDDMDALSGDFYSTEVKWGGNSIPTDTSLKIKFYLT